MFVKCKSNYRLGARQLGMTGTNFTSSSIETQLCRVSSK